MKQGWEIKKIKDICDKASSNIAQNKITELNGDYPVFGASGFVQNVDFYHRDTDYIGVVKDGSGVGRVNVYPAYSSLLGTLQYILPKEGYALNYVAYALKSLNLAEYASGAAIPHIYFKDYGEETIAVPPREEQERIVEELDCLSGVIEKKREQLRELDALAQSIFYQMFGDPITNEKGWEVKKLGEVCKFSQGVQVDLPLQSTEKKSGWNRFLRIVDYTTCNTDVRYVNISNDKYFVNFDDVVVVRYGASAGFVGIEKEGILANNLFKLNHDRNKLNYKYLYYLLSTDYYKDFVKDIAFGAAMPALSFNSFKNFNIYIPPIALQQEYAEKIEAIERQKELIKQSISKTEELFNSRMDYYFN